MTVDFPGNDKSGGRSLSCDRHKVDARNGAFGRAAQLTYDPNKSNCEGFDLPYFCGFCRN